MAYNKKLYKLMLDNFERFLMRELSTCWDFGNFLNRLAKGSCFKYNTKINLYGISSDVTFDLDMRLQYTGRRLLRVIIGDRVYFCINREHLLIKFADMSRVWVFFKVGVLDWLQSNLKSFDYWTIDEVAVKLSDIWVRDVFDADTVLHYYQSRFQICRVNDFFKDDVIDSNIIPLVCFDFGKNEVSFIAHKANSESVRLKRLALDTFMSSMSSPTASFSNGFHYPMERVMRLESDVVYKESKDIPDISGLQ